MANVERLQPHSPFATRHSSFPKGGADVAVVGGGIVGLAAARALAEARSGTILVLEAEDRLAAHQTGRNSGVIHSGLYYRPGSLKARLCTEGREALYDFCRERGIPHQRCGKLVVATRESQLAVLAELESRGRANGLSGLRRLEAGELQEFESHAAGVAGLFVPQTGVVNYAEVAGAFADVVCEHGGQIRTAARLLRVRRGSGGLILETGAGEVACRHLINCGGLHSDRIARMCGVNPGLKIIPFRGEYFELAAERRELVRGLIYPVPDPRFPFLGVHFTRGIDGRVHAGPNAVLALRREGYRRLDVSPRDCLEMAFFPGFWRMLRNHWRMGLAEWRRSLSKGEFVRALRELVPAVEERDLCPAEAGVRAQAVELTGRLVDDFRIVEADRMIHVLNAPSPAATASIAIGRHIAGLARTRFALAE